MSSNVSVPEAFEYIKQILCEMQHALGLNTKALSDMAQKMDAVMLTAGNAAAEKKKGKKKATANSEATEANKTEGSEVPEKNDNEADLPNKDEVKTETPRKPRKKVAKNATVTTVTEVVDEAEVATPRKPRKKVVKAVPDAADKPTEEPVPKRRVKKSAVTDVEPAEK